MKQVAHACCHLAPVHVDGVEDARHNLSKEQQISTIPAITPSMRTRTQQNGEHQYNHTKDKTAPTSCCIVLILGGDEEVYRNYGAKEHRNLVPKENNKTSTKHCPRHQQTLATHKETAQEQQQQEETPFNTQKHKQKGGDCAIEHLGLIQQTLTSWIKHRVGPFSTYAINNTICTSKTNPSSTTRHGH